MKFETKESSPCVVSLSVTADAEELKGECSKVLSVFYREAVIPGFRKGKAPQSLVRRKFAGEIDEKCVEACFDYLYPKALKESGLDVVNFKETESIDFSAEKGMSFTVAVEVKPVFELPKYKGLAIERGDGKVSDEEVAERMELFRKAFAKFEDSKEGDAIDEGDFVQFDYSGTLDDEAKTPLSEILPDMKVVCGSEGYWVQLEEGRFVPEILESLKGMKAGETKNDVKVAFPENGAPEAIKGKGCIYTVTVKTFRRRVLPDDKTFAENAKVDTLDALRAQIRSQMEKAAAEAELDARKTQVIAQLLEKADFAVPPSLLHRQIQNHLQDLAQRAQHSGLPSDYFEKNREKIMADAESTSLRQVRLSYILLEIAKVEGIEISERELDEAMQRMADSSNGKATAEDVRNHILDHGSMALYKEELRAEKALDLILDKAV